MNLETVGGIERVLDVVDDGCGIPENDFDLGIPVQCVCLGRKKFLENVCVGPAISDFIVDIREETFCLRYAPHYRRNLCEPKWNIADFI